MSGINKTNGGFPVQQDWRFKLGVFFILFGIIFSSIVLYFPPYDLDNGKTVEFNKDQGSGKFPVHQLPPLLAIATGAGLFAWVFMARKQWRKIHEIRELKK